MNEYVGDLITFTVENPLVKAQLRLALQDELSRQRPVNQDYLLSILQSDFGPRGMNMFIVNAFQTEFIGWGAPLMPGQRRIVVDLSTTTE